MRGGRRPGAGRKPGIPNKATREIKEAAREHSPAALRRLVYLMEKAQSESAQVAACKEILDRAWGKSTQLIGGDADSPLGITVMSGVPDQDADDDDQQPAVQTH